MLLSHASMQQGSLSPECLRQQKFERESAICSSRSQHHETTTLPVLQSSLDMVKHQAAVSRVPQYPTPDEPTRKRDIVPAWLDRQAQRLRLPWCSQSEHRDSMFDGLDSDSKLLFEGDLGRASREANEVVLDFHGEPVPQHVIDHFFGEYPAGGSDWRNSAQWEEHLADYSPWKAIQNSPEKSHSSSETPKNRDSYFSLLVWRTRSSKQRRRRGKLPEETSSDELDERPSSPFDDEPDSQTQLPEHLPNHSIMATRRPKAGIVIWDGTARSAQVSSSVRCTLVSESTDPLHIPIPWIPDLESAHSVDSDMKGPFHPACCPHGTSPLDLLHLPLVKNSIAQHVPHLRKLPSSPPCLPDSRVHSDDSLLFKISPLLSAGPSAINVQHWPSQHPSALPNPAVPRREDNNAYIIADVLSQTEDVDTSSLRKRSAPAVTATQHIPAPDPAMQFPLTPPDSRQASNASCSELSEHLLIPKEPADTDRGTCKQSDSSESSLPGCGVSISLDDLQKESRQVVRWEY